MDRVISILPAGCSISVPHGIHAKLQTGAEKNIKYIHTFLNLIHSFKLQVADVNDVFDNVPKYYRLNYFKLL